MQLNFQKVWDIVYSGGPLMIPLLLLAIILYSNIIGLLRFVSITDVKILFNLQLQSESINRMALVDFRKHFHDLITTQLTFLNVLIVAAPLLGLLGTIVGMLETFQGLGISSEDKAGLVADGVKVALITTQTGLMIAIIGLFLSQWIARIYRKKDLDLVDLEIDLMRKGS